MILEVSAGIAEGDILAIESAIRAHTNNHFHRPDYVAEVTRIFGNKVYFDAPVNLFSVGDSIEIVGVQYVDGFHVVKKVSTNYVEIELPFEIEMEYEGQGGEIYQIDYPADVKSGAESVFEHKLKMAENKGVKSKSISRMTITYDTPIADADMIFGVSSNYFDFLAPYKKLRWS